MEGSTALAAIEGILKACDPATQKEVLQGLSLPKPIKKIKSRPVSLLAAREDLIKNHFKQ